MNKERVYIEYPMKGSAAMIWRAIGTPQGLSTWFADRVEQNGKICNFYWGKDEERSALLTAQRQGTYTRLRWEDEDPQTYFEMRITYNELTNQHTLEVVDFADTGEVDDLKSLWDSQIEYLRRQSGM